jgi:hypothetical protein
MEKLSNKLTARDFTYVNDEVLGQTYRHGSYVIGVGRETYAITYQGRTIDYDLRDFLSAVEACARHEAKRISDAYTAVATGNSLTYGLQPARETRRHREAK